MSSNTATKSSNKCYFLITPIKLTVLSLRKNIICNIKNIRIKTHKTIILLANWQGCEVWSSILKEQLKMGMTGRSIRTEPRTEGWRTLHNSYSPHIIRPITSRGTCTLHPACSTHEKEVYTKFKYGKPIEERTVRRPRHRRVHDIRMAYTGCGAHSSAVVEALCYKPEYHEFESL
jgi:hypothetical protein